MRSNPPITTTTTIGRSNRPTTPRHATPRTQRSRDARPVGAPRAARWRVVRPGAEAARRGPHTTAGPRRRGQCNLVVSSAQGRGAGPLSNLATRNRRACTFSCPGPSPTPAPACAGVFAPFLRPRPTPIRSSARARWQGSAKCRGRRGRVAPAPAGGPGE
jgi:hypothetical protein